MRWKKKTCFKFYVHPLMIMRHCGRYWLAFGQRNRNPQPFRREHSCKFLRQNIVLYNCVKMGSFGCNCVGSPKASSAKPPQKQSLRKLSGGRLFESKLAFIESSLKQYDICWRLHKSLSKMHTLRQYYVSRQNRVYWGSFLSERTFPFGQRCYHATPTPATLLILTGE